MPRAQAVGSRARRMEQEMLARLHPGSSERARCRRPCQRWLSRRGMSILPRRQPLHGVRSTALSAPVRPAVSGRADGGGKAFTVPNAAPGGVTGSSLALGPMETTSSSDQLIPVLRNLITPPSTGATNSTLTPVQLANLGTPTSQQITPQDTAASGLPASNPKPASPTLIAQSETCAEFIAENCRASVLRVFPGQFLDVPVEDVLDAAKSGDAAARRAKKLLLDNRFRK